MKGAFPVAIRSAGKALVTLFVVLLAAACSSAGGPPSPVLASGSPSGSIATSTLSPVPSLAPSPAATVAASPTSPPSPVATVAASPASPAAPAATPARSISAEPPPASLAAEGGDPVTGTLGSFTWNNGGSDSPWLPGARIRVGAGERLTVTIKGAVGVATWTARRVPAGATDGAGAVGLGDGTGTITFQAPPPGIWSAQIAVRFAGDLGSATYYWRLDVK